MNGINALIKEAPRLGRPFCHVMTDQEVGSLQPGRGSSPEPNHTGTVVLEFQRPEL